MDLETLASLLLPGTLGYFITFLAAFAEALPLGAIIPGQTIVILAGFVAHQGSLSLTTVMIAAALGAIIGDAVSFYLGRHYGLSILRRYGKYVFFKEEYFTSTKRIMKDHIGKTLIFGRFMPVTRAFAPFIAGMYKVKQRLFWLYNFIGGILWAVCYALLGYLAGASYKAVERYLGVFFTIGVVGGLLLYWMYWYIARKKRWLSQAEFALAILTVISFVLFTNILDDVHDAGFWTSFDATINSFMSGVHNSTATMIAKGLHVGFGPIMMTMLVLLIIGVFWMLNRRRDALFFGVVMLLQAIVQLVLRDLIARLRPENSVITLSSSSFPSSHALSVMIFFGLLIYLSWEDLESLPKRIGAVVMFGITALLVAISRLYLNVHWFSDVLGGLTLGMFILGTAILVQRIFINRRAQRTQRTKPRAQRSEQPIQRSGQGAKRNNVQGRNSAKTVR